MLAIFGYVVCLATLSGFAGQFSWILDLCSHFRVQYLIILTIFSVFFLARRQPRPAVIFLVFAGINFAAIVPLYFGTVNRPLQGASAMRVLLLNVHTGNGDEAKVRQLIIDKDPDLIVLEEISARWLAGLSWLNDSHSFTVSQPREDNFGIALFSRLPLHDSKVVSIGSADVPSIITTVVRGNTRLQVIATHPLPPIGREYSHWRDDQLNLLPEYVNASMPVILLGDLNATPWSYHFARLLQRSGLKDSSRGYGIQPTWPNNNPLLRIPIDHLLHTSDIAILNRFIGEDVASDHFPVIVDLSIADGQTLSEN